ncbi:MAG TPA: MraY family glycosyltransferase [Ktedonobacterales bacterium]|nr:MraY family glycosyltransferase [Ktedonobacterales bacterium]
MLVTAGRMPYAPTTMPAHAATAPVEATLASANSALAQALPALAPAVAGFALAAVLTFALSLLIARLCVRWGLLDRPAARRIHKQPVPRLGGIAIFAAVVAVAALLVRPANAYEAHVYGGFFVAGALIVAVMAVDDVRGLPPLPRLGVQTLAALIAMFPLAHGTLIEVIHNPLVSASGGHIFLPLWIAVPFTWFWIVGLMNTINWVDGVDGLAGGVVGITALVMGAISWLLGQHSAALLCAIVAGATLGFLPLNWHPARMFMGDCGAMFLGLALAVLANVGGARLAMMLMLLGLPILDTARVIVRRLRQGRSPLRFDRSHLHYRLMAGGLGQRQIALIFYAITGVFGAVTILAAYLETRLGFLRVRVAGVPLGVSELPTLIGLAAVALVSVGIWRLAAARRQRTGVPPGASFVSLPSPAQSPPSARLPDTAPQRPSRRGLGRRPYPRPRPRFTTTSSSPSPSTSGTHCQP